MDCGLYLYGIFPDSMPEQLALEGMDKQPVYSTIIEGFTFLYSSAKQEKYLASRRNLICHERVLEQAMNEGFRTLLPLRFGMVIKTWETVIEQLTRPHQDKLKDLFAKLAGRREVSVKVLWDSKSELQALLSANKDLKQKRDAMEGKTMSMEEVIDIGQMIENGLLLRKQEVIQAFRDELNSLAKEVVENDPMTEEMIYNAAYLISWDAEAEFSDRVEAIDQKFGDRFRIRYNNFTAPYTFAQLF
ncbi:GvpL/GvpF family gas vesicle protein [Planktothrix sp. FACHB-1355]|uniref:GvpL/GvpF family gas vesicle protein n=1 Tax=Aerosakkonema funiforme FACHB-1375 TaxID=2949571 RepID=A0A926VCK1_9CYAN|nr:MULTISPECIES: GvpL/GvpF family gas vesicle protein [Oscillatoriales]MBD2181195.1 GvpL/GvpF family gas vesicle protein [Aerosakkonema funiforme FACHB-1375]MBD3561054.1 GvpL/GvpF family gas vesicle protein [Planktothrix sp. FACHB-1355]